MSEAGERIRIAAVGDNCVDLYDDTGEMYVGGNPVNVAVYTKRLGGDSSYTGVVGDDENGKLVIRRLREKGVDTSHVHVVSGQTAVTHVTISGGERVFGHYDEGVLRNFTLKEEDIRFLSTHDLIVSGIYGLGEAEVRRIKAEPGVPKLAFDFSDEPDNPVVERIIPYVDYAFFSFENTEMSRLTDFMHRMKAMGPEIVVVTMGCEGSAAYDGTELVRCGIVPCQVADTMGAGDSYIAGFLYARLRGLGIKECMKAGAGNSSVTLQYAGAWQ